MTGRSRTAGDGRDGARSDRAGATGRRRIESGDAPLSASQRQLSHHRAPRCGAPCRSQRTKRSRGATRRRAPPTRCDFTSITTPGGTTSRRGCASAACRALAPATSDCWRSLVDRGLALRIVTDGGAQPSGPTGCDTSRPTTATPTIGRLRRFRSTRPSRLAARRGCRSRGRRTCRAPSPEPASIGNYYFIAQWFPKIGVLQDGGWNCHQFHYATEFFADFGVYDVRLAVPAGWTVGATGVERERHRRSTAMRSTISIRRTSTTSRGRPARGYVEHRARFEHPTLPPVDMRLLLQPEHEGQEERHFAATRATLRYYGEWFGPYPYGHITIVDPAWQSGAGGMEYPTLFTAGTRWLVPREATAARRGHHSRSRPPVLVRHRRHQRVRGRLDGRRVQHLLDRAGHRAAVPTQLHRGAVFRRLRPMAVSSAAVDAARSTAIGWPAIAPTPGRTSRRLRPSATGPAPPAPSPTTRRRCGCTRSSATSDGRCCSG